MQLQSVHSVDHIPLKKEKNFYNWAGVIIVTITALATSYMTEFDVIKATLALPGIVDFLITDFFPPDVSAVPDFWISLMDTFYMAIISTVTGSIIALVLSLLSAATTSPNKVLEVIIRAVASALRNVPALAWAIILVPAFGIGKTVGLMALFIGSVGTMVRFFIETLEEIDMGGVEAIRSVGGTYWQVLSTGVMPQAIPGIISWTLYTFELSIRASTIIGMVGGGGIGFFIQFSMKLFQYDRAMMAVIVVAIVVLVTELISEKIRELMM